MVSHKTKNKKLASYSIDEKLLVKFDTLSNELCINKSKLVEKLLQGWVKNN
ncbi:hypothetical protein LCGC14_2256300, partial [marine sediment metagenome]